MYWRKLDLYCVLTLLAAVLLWVGTSQAIAQTETDGTPSDTEVTDAPDEPADEPGDATNPPRYITELKDAGLLTQEQVDSMRADGLGWGEIRIAVRLAEQIAAAGGEDVTVADALAQVLEARAAGKGFGEIAGENDLKIGQLVGNGSRKMGPAPADAGGQEAHQGAEAGQTARVTERKQGFLARLGRFLGFGRRERVNQDPEATGLNAPGKTDQTPKARNVERVTRMQKPERPAKPERVEKPERPERPEKPERGPNR